jgi:hypothetical protein
VRRCVVLALLVACGGKREEHKAAPTAPPQAQIPTPSPAAQNGAAPACEQQPFAESTPVPEASGAAWMEIDGKLVLVVAGDSGHDGAFGLVDPETGVTSAQGKLPLGKGASDDIEGVASRGARLYGLTSSGYMREWEWKSGTFVLVAGPYPIGTGDWTCKAQKTNCGKNYEGLAIAPTPIGECAAYACSKETGAVYCLRDDGGKLVVSGTAATTAVTIVNKTEVLADCAFADDGVLYVGNNLFGLARTFRVENLADPQHAKITDLGTLGTGFPETVAARGDIVYRMSDMGGDGASLMLKFRCPRAGR